MEVSPPVRNLFPDHVPEQFTIKDIHHANRSPHHSSSPIVLLRMMTIATAVAALALGGTTVAAAPASSGATSTTPAPKAACAIPNAMPSAPSAQGQIAQFSGAWAADDRFNATIWRERLAPRTAHRRFSTFESCETQGISFICGGELQITQNGVPYDVRFVQDVSHTAFCDNLPGDDVRHRPVPGQPAVRQQLCSGLRIQGRIQQRLFGRSTGLQCWQQLRHTGSRVVVQSGGIGIGLRARREAWRACNDGLQLHVVGLAHTQLLAAGPIVNSVFTATLDKYAGGQCISCSYRPTATNGNDGIVSISFIPNNCDHDTSGRSRLPDRATTILDNSDVTAMSRLTASVDSMTVEGRAQSNAVRPRTEALRARRAVRTLLTDVR